MTTIELTEQEYHEVIQALEAQETACRSLRLELEARIKGGDEGDLAAALLGDMGDIERIQRLGPVVEAHLAYIEKHGRIDRKSSLIIRKHFLPDGVDIRSTANYFGTKDSNSPLYRDVPHGSPVRDADPIKLTVEGRKLAAQWRLLHDESEWAKIP